MYIIWYVNYVVYRNRTYLRWQLQLAELQGMYPLTAYEILSLSFFH